jgi:hypothetical protein
MSGPKQRSTQARWKARSALDEAEAQVERLMTSG